MTYYPPPGRTSAPSRVRSADDAAMRTTDILRWDNRTVTRDPPARKVTEKAKCAPVSRLPVSPTEIFVRTRGRGVVCPPRGEVVGEPGGESPTVALARASLTTIPASRLASVFELFHTSN